MNKNTSKRIDHQTLLYKIINELADTVTSEHKRLQAELEQVSSVVKDAERTLKLNIEGLDDEKKANVTRVLQFEDIVQQLIKHARHRSRKLENFFVKLTLKIAQMESIKPDDDVLKKHIEVLQKVISGFHQTASDKRPVKQSSMQEGKTELF